MFKTLIISMFAFIAVLQVSAVKANAYESFATCAAYTPCPYGGAVYCTVYAEATTSTACTWFVQPYVGVECHGFDGYGNWQDYFSHC